MTRRALMLLIGIPGLLIACGLAAWAFWSANGTANQVAVSSTLLAPTAATATPVAGAADTIRVTVTAGPSSPSPAATGYTVKIGATTECTITGDTGSCDVDGLSPDAAATIDIYSNLGSAWISATKLTKSATTNPAAPSTVTVTGAGAGGAFINNAGKSAVSVVVALPASSKTSQTVNLTATDGTSTVTAATQAGTAGTGTRTFNVNTTSLSDGTITFTSWVTATGTSTNTTATKTKDVLAPSAPTSVALANGGGMGGAFINSANVGSLDYDVTWVSGGPQDAAGDTISVALTSTASVTGTATRGAASPTTVSTLNGTSLASGTVTASATAIDAAGNASGAVTSSNVKDVTAPSTPNVVTLTNGLGSGLTYISASNASSVNYNVGWASGATSTDTITVSLASSGGGTPSSGSAARGASGTNTAITGIDASGLNDGTVTATATATDLAGNSSGGRTNTVTNVKDVDNPDLVTLEMFDGTSSADANGKIDRIVATFDETLQTVSGASTHGFQLSNVPSNGSRGNASYSGTAATLTVVEGSDAANTAVGAFTVALSGGSINPWDAAGNPAQFAATAPADKAGPVPITVADTYGTTDGKFENGDTLTVTFSEAVAQTWTAPKAGTVVLTGGNGSNADTVTMSDMLAGSVSLPNNYMAGNNNVASFAATYAKPSANQVRVTLGACTSTLGTGCDSLGTGSSTTFTFTPLAAVLPDAAGNVAIGSRGLSGRLF